MGAVVGDTELESDSTNLALGDHERYGHESVPGPVSHHAHHHFTYPSAMYHTFGGLTHKNTAIGEFAHWTPNSDVRETEIAYHIEMEVAGVSDKKTIKVACLAPRTLLVEGVAERADLLRGREGDGESVWKGEGVANGADKKLEAKKVEVNGKDDIDGGPCTKCADTENEMTTKVIHGERKIGSWHRTFTLPVGCDLTTTKAKLDAGLLHISVFKKDRFGANKAKIVTVE